MSYETVAREILEPMQRLFLPPRSMPADHVAAALREYAEALSGFDAEALNLAWTTVRGTHLARSWPTPGVFVVAARNAQRELSRSTSDGSAGEHKTDFEIKRELWDAAKMSLEARSALRGNVAWSFKCRVFHDGCAHETISISDLMAKSRSAAALAGRIENGEPSGEWKGRFLGPMDEPGRTQALKMYRNIQILEAETQDEIRRAQNLKDAA